MNNLSDKEKRILSVAELQADLSAPQIAKRTGLREHVVRYALRRLRSQGIISPPRPFVNMYRLNYCEYQLHFSVGGAGHQARKNLLNKLIASPVVAWLYETGGDYQYAALISIHDMRDLFQLIDDIQQPADDLIISISLALRRSYTLFAHDLIPGRRRARRALSYGIESTPVDKDQLNLKLLTLMSQGRYETLRDLAQALSSPMATIVRHKKRLEQTKAIEGYIYGISPSKLGLSICRLVISVRGNSAELRQQLFDFTQKCRWSTSLVESIGNWDYVLGVDTPEPLLVSEVRDDLLRQFGSQIYTLGSFVCYRMLKLYQYRF